MILVHLVVDVEDLCDVFQEIETDKKYRKIDNHFKRCLFDGSGDKVLDLNFGSCVFSTTLLNKKFIDKLFHKNIFKIF